MLPSRMETADQDRQASRRFSMASTSGINQQYEEYIFCNCSQIRLRCRLCHGYYDVIGVCKSIYLLRLLFLTHQSE